MNDYFKDLLTYEKWALDELICTLETVDDSQKVGKISLMLSHILLAQEVWINDWKGLLLIKAYGLIFLLMK